MTKTHDNARRWVVGHGRRLVAFLLAAALSTPTVLAAAQQDGSAGLPPAGEQEERLAAGQLPTEADVLVSEFDEGFPLTINFVDTDIRDVARFFSNLTGLNVVLDPEISGPVTVTFFDVPWDVAFKAILRSHQLGYQVDRNIVRVSSMTSWRSPTATLVTSSFSSARI